MKKARTMSGPCSCCELVELSLIVPQDVFAPSVERHHFGPNFRRVEGAPVAISFQKRAGKLTSSELQKEEIA